jgi:putative hydrolase of the HAD superfamily
MARQDADVFAEVDTWIFDLDNTLYPASSNLFSEVSKRMTLYIAEHFGISADDARKRQRDFFERYGTTLRGLMVEHQLDPLPFLDYVHEIDLAPLCPDPLLAEKLAALPGRKLIFTNSTRQHAQRIMDRIGVTAHFKEIFDISSADYIPKPDKETYARMLYSHGITAERACMIDDLAWNLEPAKALGMKTVWLNNDLGWARPQDGSEADYAQFPYVDRAIDNLCTWLDEVIASRG